MTGLVICVGVLCCTTSFGQSKDSLQTEDKEEKSKNERFMNHSPTKATLYAVALPGLGQIYNGKYWKLPIVYGGFAAVGYLIVDNHKYYKQSRTAFLDWDDNNTQSVVINGRTITSRERVRLIKDDYRRSRDFAYVLAAALYTLQIVDANVDAHLMDFEVSDDLLLSWRPTIRNQINNPIFGLSLTLSTRK